MTVKVLGDYKRTDRLWVVIPYWDEGDDHDPAVGTASLVIAPTKKEAEEAIDAGWVEAFEMPARWSFD